MAKARTLSPCYTKTMQRMETNAKRAGNLQMILAVTKAVRHARFRRAYEHLVRHSYPAPATGVDYTRIDATLGMMARFS